MYLNYISLLICAWWWLFTKTETSIKQ